MTSIFVAAAAIAAFAVVVTLSALVLGAIVGLGDAKLSPSANDVPGHQEPAQFLQ